MVRGILGVPGVPGRAGQHWGVSGGAGQHGGVPAGRYRGVPAVRGSTGGPGGSGGPGWARRVRPRPAQFGDEPWEKNLGGARGPGSLRRAGEAPGEPRHRLGARRPPREGRAPQRGGAGTAAQPRGQGSARRRRRPRDGRARGKMGALALALGIFHYLGLYLQLGAASRHPPWDAPAAGSGEAAAAAVGAREGGG